MRGRVAAGLFVSIKDCRNDSPLHSWKMSQRASRLWLFVSIKDCRNDSPLHSQFPHPDIRSSIPHPDIRSSIPHHINLVN